DPASPVPFSFLSASSSHMPRRHRSVPVTAKPQAGDLQIFSFPFPFPRHPFLCFLPLFQLFQEPESPQVLPLSDTVPLPLRPSTTANPPRPPGSESVPSHFPHRPGQ